jgi:uncharacterized protein
VTSRRVMPFGPSPNTATELLELQLEVPADAALARIQQRRAQHADASDATAEVAEAMRARFAPWPEATRLDATRPLSATVEAALSLVD